MAKKSIEDKTIEKIETTIGAIKVLQDHGEGCGCWECAQANADISSAEPKIISVASKIAK